MNYILGLCLQNILSDKRVWNTFYHLISELHWSHTLEFDPKDRLKVRAENAKSDERKGIF